MPLILDRRMPVYGLLEQECPQVLARDGSFAGKQVLKLLFFNLMRDTVSAELQYLRCLGTAPQYIQVDFLRQVSYRSASRDEDYFQKFYLSEQDIATKQYDAMLITGAPLEHISCEDTRYWEEFCRILQWTKTHVKSVFAGCWGAFAALYRDHGVTKTSLPKKISGIFPLNCYVPREPLFEGCGQPLCVPLSRATDMDRSAVLSAPGVILLADACNGTPVFLKSKDSQYIYCTAHPEYERDRLAFEYERDSAKPHTWETTFPANYFPEDDPDKVPFDHWIEPGKRLFRNWIQYYVSSV